MRKTKLLALVLVVAMIATMFVPSVAAAEDYTLSIVDKATGAATINANAGDTVDVYVTISNNPGVSCVAFNVSVPEGWSIKAAQNQKLFMGDAAEQASSDNYTAGPNKDYFLWLMALGTQGDDFEGIAGGKLLTQNGNLVLIRYQIPEDAQTGAYTISVTPDLTNCFHTNVDSNGYIVPSNGKTNQVPGTESLTINVQGTEPEVPEGAACPEHPEVTTWTDVAENEWAAGGALTSGHYKLTGNQATTAALTVAEGENVCIDLNGYNITAGAKAGTSKVSYRVFNNKGTLAILDSTAAEVEGVYTAGTISGGALKVQGDDGDNTFEGACGGNILNAGTFTLVDGIIADGYLEGGAYDSKDVGGNICSTGGTLNIKGGWIKDGENKRTSQNGGTSSRRGGGNIAAFDTDVNITGGMITGGYVYGTYGYSNATARNSYLYGGNMLISGGSLDIANATIANGKIEYTLTASKATVLNQAYGGNIFVESVGDINIVNSTISGGQVKAYSTASGTCTVKAQGGNIWMKLSDKTNVMSIDANSIITEGLTDGTSGSHASAATAVASPSLDYRGSNIYLERGTLDIYGELSKGQGQRGSIFTPGTSVINVYEGAKLYGSTCVAEYGHEITATASTVNIMGGTISTSVTTPGAAIYALYSAVNISGGTIEHTGKDGYAIMTYTTSDRDVLITQNGGSVLGKVKVDDNCQWNVTGGVIDGRISDNGVLTVGAGVIFYNEPSKYVADFEAYATMKDAEDVDCYKTYGTLSEALAAAQAGDTVALVKDATATDVVVPAAVTLDLNGNTLTANELAAALEGAQVKDSKGAAKLVVENMENVSFGESNNQLPVTTAEGCVFETVEFAENLSVENAQYKFYIKNESAATMLDEAILNGYAVSIDVTVTWTEAEGNGRKVFTFTGDMLQEYAGKWDTKMFTLTFGDLAGITNLDCTASVTCNGVTVEA